MDDTKGSKSFQRCTLFCLLAICFGLSLAQGQTIQDVLPVFKERWRWEVYWGQGIAKVPFKPFVNKPIQLYSSRSVVGFCIPHFDYCASYEWDGKRLGGLLVQGRCGVVSPSSACVAGFIRDNAPGSLNWMREDVATSTEHVSVGALEHVEPAMTEASSKRVERLKAWLRATVFVESVAERTIIVPRFSETDPEIYVLLEVPEPEPSAVLIIRCTSSGTSFESAGEIVSIWPRYSEYRKRIIRIEAWRGVLP